MSIAHRNGFFSCNCLEVLNLFQGTPFVNIAGHKIDCIVMGKNYYEFELVASGKVFGISDHFRNLAFAQRKERNLYLIWLNPNGPRKMISQVTFELI